MNEFQTIIGLEVHVELLTESKMFCCCSTRFGKEPNTQVCPVCLGLPGALPVVNEKAIELGIKTAAATNCKINEEFIFVRKSYFYPDLPKNFQISQYREPLAVNGYLYVNGRKIGITRIHLEEDTGKLLHDEKTGNWSCIDFNRSGIPLMEIVTDPEISTPEEAEDFLRQLRQIISYIGVSDCIMEEGSLRCDANISIKKTTDSQLGTKVEVKNMNSFRSVRRALTFEQERMIEILEKGQNIVQETRLWNEQMQVTEGMRTKEEAHDYRYFPEPDLLPFRIDAETIKKISLEIGELPDARKNRFQQNYGLSLYDSEVLTAEKPISDYFEKAVSCYHKPKQIANLIQTELLGLLKENHVRITECRVKPEFLASIVKMIDNKEISSTVGKIVLRETFVSGTDPEIIVREKNLIQITDTEEIGSIIQEILNEHPQAINDYRAGKVQALGFLVGQVMKKSKNKANPGVVKQILEKKLTDRSNNTEEK